MKFRNKLWRIAITLFILAIPCLAGVAGFDEVSISCSAVATTGACTSYNVAPADNVHIPSVASITWQTIIAGGTATSISVTLQGSIDNSNWVTLDTSTSTTGELRTATAAVKFFRCNVGSYTTNATTLTCQVMPGRSEGGAVNVTRIAGTVPVLDPCQANSGSQALINLTAGGTMITGTSAKQTYICALDIVSATAQNIALVEGTGTVCATNIAGMAGGTTAATGWNLAANDGLVKGSGGFWVYKTATTGDNVCLLLSSSGQTSGAIRYVQQ